MNDVTVLPDGSVFFTASFPLQPDHWIFGVGDGDGFEPPPMGFRTGTTDPQRVQVSALIREAAKYAVRAATMNGSEMDFDPDALVQNLVVAMLGYCTDDGLDAEDDWANPKPVPNLFPWADS